MKPNVQRMAERFRYYAELSRELAKKFPASAADLMRRAETFERDAVMIERDAKLIAETEAFLRRIEIPSARIVRPDGEESNASASE